MDNKRKSALAGARKNTSDNNISADIDYGGNPTIVPNGLPARIVRNLMMCKGGLADKNTIYYGTGESEQVMIDVVEGSETVTYEYNIPKVAVITPPSNSGKYKLVCDNGTLKWEVDEED